MPGERVQQGWKWQPAEGGGDVECGGGGDRREPPHAATEHAAPEEAISLITQTIFYYIAETHAIIDLAQKNLLTVAEATVALLFPARGQF